MLVLVFWEHDTVCVRNGRYVTYEGSLLWCHGVSSHDVVSGSRSVGRSVSQSVGRRPGKRNASDRMGSLVSPRGRKGHGRLKLLVEFESH